jgi:signal transduction histidine kinase
VQLNEVPVLLRPDRGTQYISLFYYPLQGDGEVAAGVLGFGIDVTPWVRARHDLEAAAALKNDFLGMVSHELRTPLTIVRGNASVLARRPDMPSDTRREVVADLLRESERLSRIVDNMFVLARLDAGQLLPTEPVHLLKAVDHAVQQFQTDTHTDSQVSIRALAPDLVALATNEYVQQVLHNLLSNAQKYSPPGSTITITLAQAGTDAMISVADRGRGVEKPEDLFRPFSRQSVDDTTQGLGVGLAVCKRLVEAMRGTIWVEPRDGGGSVFSFEIPLAPLEAESNLDVGTK